MTELSKFRKGSGYTQKEMAGFFNISRQAYYRKEKGYTPFTDDEKILFRDLTKPMFPNITIEKLFFMNNTKKCKEEEDGRDGKHSNSDT